MDINERLKHEREHGKKISENAEDVWGWGSPAGQIRANRRAAYLYNLGKWTSQDHLLEIGAGTGLFTKKVYDATHAKIIATELSEDLINIAQSKYPEIEWKIEDAMNLSFTDNSFDGVFGSSILHHLELEKSLIEILRVLKPGGRMIFAEPNMVNPQILIQKNVGFIKKALGDSPDETAITRWPFKKKMEDLGYRNVRIFPYDFLHPITPTPLIGVVNILGKIVEKIPILKEIAGSVIIYGEK
ncbi:MAG: class I SAM-dependent methyltransferase [Bacteroidota bacterium]|nr:class I SAM-dependent methyltransferase [Bacteroidota bacterium]